MDQAQRLREMVSGKVKKRKKVPVLKKENNTANRPEIITITSGKGGVGKSNTCVNLAFAMASTSKRVLIIDVDIGLGNTDLLLGVYPSYSLLEYLKGKCSLEQAIMRVSEKVDIIAGGELAKDDFLLSSKERDVISTDITELKLYDYIIFDTGAGISSNISYFCQSADRVLVLTTPEPTAITDAYALMKSLYRKSKDLEIQIIVNKVISVQEGYETANKLITVSQKFLLAKPTYLGYIFEDSSVTKAVRKQVPYIKEYPASSSSKSVYQLAASITGSKVINSKTPLGFLSALFKR
ncbi:MinD/ParA family protein [Proteinivorax hydrogeniformans]|uniref:MinD/ParA family protein n=1 Tax=Proteinivorax hydrogeniformans TaxID=1826727 RepID=A0AAU8HP21_9FIRM